MESGKKQELWEKLRRVGKRGGNTTPVASFWRRNEAGDSVHPLTGGGCGGGGGEEEHDRGDLSENAPTLQFISSRKLAAALWELHRYHGDVTVVVPPPPCLRRLKLNHRRSSPPFSPDDTMPESSSNSRRYVAESLARIHRSIEKNPHAIPTASPPSYGSSMEIAPYKPAVSPSMSSSCLRTSTELLKVVNRIRKLEEQHVANTSLIKALKKELHCARSEIKELSREHQADRNHFDQLMKHITEDKLVRKNKEQDRDEMENERQLSLRSESLQRELVGELREAKTSLASIYEEVEKERKSCDQVKDLCDELALGVREKSKRADHDDPLILRISELWLHEQRKTKLQQCGGENNSTIDKLGTEIEAFLQSKRKIKGNKDADQKHVTSISQNENCEAAKDDVSKQKHESEGTTGLNSLPESGQARIHHGVASSVRSYSKASSKCPHENDSKANVPEAKTRHQRPHSRKKASIIPSTDE